MPKWSRDTLPTLVLAGIAGLLLLAVTVEWLVLRHHRDAVLAAHVPKAPTPPGAPDASETPGKFSLPGLDGYKQMAERPLFMEGRRPGAEPEDTPAAPVAQTPLNLKLMGIVFAPSGKMALIADAKGKYKRMKAQDSFDGWTLVDLAADRVTMQQGEERKDLPLLKSRPKPPPGAAGTPPGAPRGAPATPPGVPPGVARQMPIPVPAESPGAAVPNAAPADGDEDSVDDEDTDAPDEEDTSDTGTDGDES